MQNDPTTQLTHEFQSYMGLDPAELTARIRRVKAAMGPRLLVLGHHYQRDSVVALADLRGDSYQLSARAAADDQCRAIVFCGVHFMAETADILANRPERLASRGGRRVDVVLPDLEAGCSLADMARIDQVEACWRELAQVIDVEDVMPITYVNSAADLKAFCGRHGGIVCTSANARAVLDWAFARRGRVLFFPDQHLGRNTALAMGLGLEEMPVWDPDAGPLGGNAPEALQRGRVILWQGSCCVHQNFRPEYISQFRARYPGIKIIVHPECRMDVVAQADAAGSTGAIIRAVEQSPPGTRWAIGTEQNLVQRLKRDHPEQEIHLLTPTHALCKTMYLIDLPRVCWAMENLAAGAPVNVVRVDDEIACAAAVALERMLDVK